MALKSRIACATPSLVLQTSFSAGSWLSLNSISESSLSVSGCLKTADEGALVRRLLRRAGPGLGGAGCGLVFFLLGAMLGLYAIAVLAALKSMDVAIGDARRLELDRSRLSKQMRICHGKK